MQPPDWPQFRQPAGQETNFFKGGHSVTHVASFTMDNWLLGLNLSMSSVVMNKKTEF